MQNSECPCSQCQGQRSLRLELNGVANIHTILQFHPEEVSADVRAQILAELDTLERYMIEFSRAAKQSRGNALWHEIKADKDKYPTNREL